MNLKVVAVASVYYDKYHNLNVGPAKTIGNMQDNNNISRSRLVIEVQLIQLRGQQK